ncbi:hypothetical protein [Streptomyces roseolus]|uniref:hypothetical protein n=1 Tax=Streptomyces roseolus TaxID=67358 RepID=UPI0037B0E063
MPTHDNPPSTAYQSVPDGDLPPGFVRARRLLRLVPDPGAFDPNEARIREQLHAMGVHPMGAAHDRH